ncbi:MAG TPA: amidohydrolase family protein [Planctomycetota bacterium]
MLAGLLLSLPTPTLPSPQAQSSGPTEGERIAIRAERIILRPGVELTKGTLLLERGVVVRVGQDLSIPEGVRVVEGAVACAGFVDPWSSLGLDPDSVGDLGASAATRSIDALDPWLVPAERREALLAGVTSARVQIARGALIAGIGALVQTTERSEPSVVREDACLAGSVGVSRGGRTGDIFDRAGEVDRLVGALEKGKRYRESQVDFKKELETWTKAIAEKLAELEKDFKKAKKDREKDEKDAKEKGKEFKDKKYKEDKKPRRPRFDPDDEALARAVDGELPLVVEVHRASEIRRLLDRTAGFDRLRLVLAGATEALAFADELVERRIPVILWPAPMGTSRPDEYEGHDLALAGALAREGVRVLIGSGGGGDAQELRFLAALAVGHGMEPAAALAAITSAPAAVFDAGDRLGTLEPGRSGDVLVFDGDPLDTRATLRAVVSRGEVVFP